MANIRGSGQPTRQADEKEWVPGVGWTSVEVYEGPKDAIEGLGQTLAGTVGYSRIRIYSSDNVVYRLNATIGGFDGGSVPDVVNTWEIIGQTKQEDGFNHPTSRTIDDDDIDLIYRVLDDSSKREEAVFVAGSNAAKLWELLEFGADVYENSYTVLRHTLTANSYDAIAYSMANINRRHTRGQLPTDIYAPIAVAIDSIPVQTVPSGFQWSWLKQHPEIIQTINSRPQVITEWWLYGWSTYYYAAAPVS